MTLEQIIQKAIEDDFAHRGWHGETYKHHELYNNVTFRSTDLARSITNAIHANLATLGELLDRIKADREREQAREEIRVRID